MKTTFEKIDELRKQLKNKEQLKLLSEIRREIKRRDIYSAKLCDYLSDTLDGMEPEESANQLKLI